MNNQSPLVPQGSLLEQKNKGRARVRIAVFVVLAIHGIGLLALLMQGCKKEPEPGPVTTGDTNTNVTPAFVEPTNAIPAPGSEMATLPTNPLPTPEPVPQIPPVVATATEYKVEKGDTFTTIAKKFHVSVRAIQDANPGVDPTKLQIGQTLHVPPAPAPAPTNGGMAAPMSPLDSAGDQVYTVKSGDTLIDIARRFGVTVKAIRTANNLITDRIKVGQKLNIPAKAPTTAPAPGATSAPETSAGVPASTPGQ